MICLSGDGRLLDRLNFYKCLSDFQASSTELMAFVGAKQISEPCINFSDMTGVFSSIGTSLGQILTFMKDSMKKTTGLDNGKEYCNGAGCIPQGTVIPLFAVPLISPNKNHVFAILG